jgi:ABC-type lipoprotein export system ATPase subunit
VILAEKLKVEFRGPAKELVPVLDIPSFEVKAGEQVCLVGGSGSGKTTFLNVLAGITPATAGRVYIDGTDIMALAEGPRDKFRAANIGYVFQSFNLLQGLSARENVALAGTFVGRGPGSSRKRARELLKRLELGHRVDARPGTLSVGEQQRVGIARALMNEPKVVLADEPTANLDDAGAARALDLLMEVVAERGATLVLVTHDSRVRARFDSVLELSDINRASTETRP